MSWLQNLRKLTFWPHRRAGWRLVAAAALTVIAGEARTDPLSADSDGVPSEVRAAYSRPQYIRFPDSAPFDQRVALLGKMLFFDPRLSGSGAISCASCHNPSFAWELPTRTTPNGAMLERQPPTLLDIAWSESLFWNGRVKDLEKQAEEAIVGSLEMKADVDSVVLRLRQIADYDAWFREAFPARGLAKETVLRALATYERTIVSGWAPFDDWIAGDEAAISEEAKRGFQLFTGKAGCARCHGGWSFRDGGFHNIGLDETDQRAGDDAPRYKTPSLREIEKRAPYMHDGSLPDLREVLAHYILLPEGATPDLTPAPIDMDEADSIIAFLRTLSSTNAHIAAPALPAR